MSEPQNSAEFVINLWPGETRTERRRAMADSLGYTTEKVRYWERIGQIPQGEWAYILECAARDGVDCTAVDFIRHLLRPVSGEGTAEISSH